MTIKRDGPYVITGDPSATVATVDDKKGVLNDETTQIDRARSDVISAPSNLPLGEAKSAAEATAAKKAAVEEVAQQVESDEGNQPKQSVASVDPAETGENSVEADETTSAPSYRPQQEIHRKPRVQESRRRSTKRRARSRRRYNDEKAARMKRKRRSAARQRRRRAYRNKAPSHRRRYPRRRVWEDDWSFWHGGTRH
jgi:hypothetical protein